MRSATRRPTATSAKSPHRSARTIRAIVVPVTPLAAPVVETVFVELEPSSNMNVLAIYSKVNRFYWPLRADWLPICASEESVLEPDEVAEEAAAEENAGRTTRATIGYE